MPQLLRIRHPISVKGTNSNRSAPASESREPFSPLEYSPSPTYLTSSVQNSLNGKAPYPSYPNHVLARRAGREHHHDFDQHAGAEPGVNPRSRASIAEYSHFRQDCVIDVIDYDSDDVNMRRYDNAGFISMLKEKGVRDTSDAASLPPRMVRWINIGGIDWGVLSSLALKYNLHSLALEDILHERGHNHSKADYYLGHLFMRVLCHTLDIDVNHEPISTPADSEMTLPKGEPLQDSTELLRDQPLDLEGGNTIGMPKEHSKDSIPLASSPPKNGSAPVAQGKKDGQKPGNGLSNILPHFPLKKRLTGLSGFGGPARQQRNMQIDALKKGDRVVVKHQPMFIFLLTDGTVISLHPEPNLDYTSPIADRLYRADSVLRTSEDASLLVESLLDLIVDRVLEVVDEYQTKISQLERDILLHPAMQSVRSLHIMSGDLIMHKRTLDPIRTMVSGLRRYDLERSRALADTIAAETRYLAPDTDTESVSTVDADTDDRSSKHSAATAKAKVRDKASHRRGGAWDHHGKAKARRRRQHTRAAERAERARAGRGEGVHQGQEQAHDEWSWDDAGVDALHDPRHAGKAPAGAQSQVEGYFSYRAKVYLADVNDHMDFALTSLNMFADTTENLINYAFNTASYDMNIVMSRLTLVTIIFLPLTLMTGYFGMNFKPFWSIDNHSDRFFWEVAIPVMVVLVPIFMLAEIKKFFRYLKRRMVSHEAGRGMGTRR